MHVGDGLLKQNRMASSESYVCCSLNACCRAISRAACLSDEKPWELVELYLIWRRGCCRKPCTTEWTYYFDSKRWRKTAPWASFAVEYIFSLVWWCLDGKKWCHGSWKTQKWNHVLHRHSNELSQVSADEIVV